VRELAPVRTDDAVGRERVREPCKPVHVGGDGVLRREDEHLAAGPAGRKVAGRAVHELGRRDLVHRRAELTRALDASVGRAGVDHDDFHVVVHLLGSDRLEAPHQVGAAVLHGNEDGDHCGVAATTN